MPHVINWLRLIRLVNCILAAVGVWIGAFLTWEYPQYFGPTVVSIAAFLTCAAGNILNDLVDTRVDAVNRPDRVLVTGEISRRAALIAVIALNVASVILGLAVSLPVLALGLVTIALLTAYNLKLKRLPLLGNMAVALSAGLTFVAGGLAVDPALVSRFPGPMVGAIFAFLFHLVREIVKDVEDMPGDQKAGLGSLPLAIGAKTALLVALIIFAALVLLTLIPVWGNWFGDIYLYLTLFLVDLPLLVILFLTWRQPGRKRLAFASSALKAGMVLGLLALLLG